MKVSILAVGRVRGVLAPAVREFEERAGRYWKLEVTEVEAGAGRGGGRDPQDVQRSEGRRLMARVTEGSETWALTREGKGMSSRALAATLGRMAVEASPGVTFLIGGAYGLDSGVIDGADRKLSLSPMTLPHEMARLVLAEQLYRAGTILRNEPYHKGRS